MQTLYANGFFKSLHLAIVSLPYDFDFTMLIQQMISFNALEILDACTFYSAAMSQLIQLKELHFFGFGTDVDFEQIAQNLINLEQLHIRCTIDQLMPFLRHSTKLKFITFYDCYEKYDALNVSNLNQVRRTGGMQRKIQIGVNQEQYLATKWKENNGNGDLVEITRAETIHKYFHFV